MSDGENGIECPAPRLDDETIQMAHGGGGRAMQSLIETLFRPALAITDASLRHDAAVLTWTAPSVAITTDSYVVRPLFFPGSDIGALAVNGTVNDIAMAGAVAELMTVGFVLEEGLALCTLERVLVSMRRAAEQSRVRIVAGDTKVVERGKGDGIFINTTAVGAVLPGARVHPSRVREGDAVIVSRDIGRHGTAILSVREGLQFEGDVASDCAPLVDIVRDLISDGIDVHCLRDATRGGVAAVLNEIASEVQRTIAIDEAAVPVASGVRGACELLGLDPLYVANEGTFVAFVAPEDADRTVAVMRRHRNASNAARIGYVGPGPEPAVFARTALGAQRRVDSLMGEQLPRIC